MARYSSFKKQQLLTENWRKFLEEDRSPYEEIQQIIDGNQYLKGKIEASEKTVHDLGDKFLLMSGVGHLKERHADPCFPGSLFLKDEETIMQAVMAAVKQIDPAIGKVLAVQTGIEGLGKERLVKLRPEEITDFEEMDAGGIVKIKKVPKGKDGKVTDRLSVIAPRIGDAGGKPVLSLVTAFPGYMGTGKGPDGDIEIKSRDDFTKNGYVFLLPEEC